MTAMPHTAFIMAAGLGTRMRPLTNTTPKPLIKVAGRSIIDRLLDALVAAGVGRAIVNVHWLADQMETHLAGRTDIEIIISDERDELLETGGGLAKARPLLGEDPVFIVNADVLWSPGDAAPLAALAEAYDPGAMDELLLLADLGRCLGFPGAGDFFRSDDGALARRGDAPSAPWAYAGVRIANPQTFHDLPVEKFSANRLWEPMIAARRLHGLPLNGFWLHIGDPGALADAEMWLRCHGA
ncbi:MAG: nucleotidyltransferase family protein [Pseudomonadota bacterium]